MEFDTTTADLIATQESRITRLLADLERAETLLTNAGVPFRRTPDPTMPWAQPKDNAEALAERAVREAELARQMDELCGPTAYHRANGRKPTPEGDMLYADMVAMGLEEADERDTGC